MVDVASGPYRHASGRKTRITGIRPGEKIHEVMVSEEEAGRAVSRGRWYAILPMLPELQPDSPDESCLQSEFSSDGTIMSLDETRSLLERNRLLLEDEDPPLVPAFASERGHELLR